jgi:hypothetical protein
MKKVLLYTLLFCCLAGCGWISGVKFIELTVAERPDEVGMHAYNAALFKPGERVIINVSDIITINEGYEMSGCQIIYKEYNNGSAFIKVKENMDYVRKLLKRILKP